MVMDEWKRIRRENQREDRLKTGARKQRKQSIRREFLDHDNNTALAGRLPMPTLRDPSEWRGRIVRRW